MLQKVLQNLHKNVCKLCKTAKNDIKNIHYQDIVHLSMLTTLKTGMFCVSRCLQLLNWDLKILFQDIFYVMSTQFSE